MTEELIVSAPHHTNKRPVWRKMNVRKPEERLVLRLFCLFPETLKFYSLKQLLDRTHVNGPSNDYLVDQAK